MPEKKDSLEEIRLLHQIGQDMARAVDSCNPKKFKQLLRQLNVDPESPMGKKRMAAFYRACNMDIP